jgi:hypothetical protein
MHGDAVMIAVLEQLARPPERFELGAEILAPLQRFRVPRTGHQTIVIANSVRHLIPQGFWQEAGFPRRLL